MVRIVTAAVVVVLISLNLMLYSQIRTAEAIPNAQEACAFDVVTVGTPAVAVPIPGMSVTINNGAAARTAIVQFSGDTGVSDNAETRISYSVDGGAPQENVFGPANLANHQQFFEARAVIAVIPLPAGTHTVAAHWRTSGAAGSVSTMVSRCMTIEARTR